MRFLTMKAIVMVLTLLICGVRTSNLIGVLASHQGGTEVPSVKQGSPATTAQPVNWRPESQLYKACKGKFADRTDIKWKELEKLIQEVTAQDLVNFNYKVYYILKRTLFYNKFGCEFAMPIFCSGMIREQVKFPQITKWAKAECYL